METKISLPNYKMEDIPVIGGFVITRAEKDLTEITEAAPDIDKAFIDRLKEKKETVRKLFEIKLNRAASQLKNPPQAFGLSNLRSQIRKRKAEGTLAALELMLHEVDANAAALEAKGFTKEMRDEYSAAIQAIDLDNDLQNEKMDERGELTMENKVIISDFWKGITELMVTGRLLYKDNPAKRKEYTFAVLHRRVGATRTKAGTPDNISGETTGMLSVTTTNKATGDALEGVQITVINRGITAETDDDGEGYADGLPAGKASISLVKQGFVDAFVNDIEIKQGEETEIDVEMEPSI